LALGASGWLAGWSGTRHNAAPTTTPTTTTTGHYHYHHTTPFNPSRRPTSSLPRSHNLPVTTSTADDHDDAHDTDDRTASPLPAHLTLREPSISLGRAH